MVNYSDSWLARQNRKKSRRTCICWIFWLCFIVLVAAVVGVVVWCLQNDIFDGGKDDNDDTLKMVRRRVVSVMADMGR
jgi:flagellar basal body-associated protein FliL